MAADIKDTAGQSTPREVDEMYVFAISECYLTKYISTRNNQLNSPLLRLPGEIRNRIYEYIFSGLETRVIDSYWGDPPCEGTYRAVYILATCRQILHEASSIFWQECIVDARNCMSYDCLYGRGGPSWADCARITSLLVTEDDAHELLIPCVLQNFPKLRKVYVEQYNVGADVDWYDEELQRDLSAKGLEVELREMERTRTSEA